MADPEVDRKRYTPPGQRFLPGSSKKIGDRPSSQQNKEGERSQPMASPKIIILKDSATSEAYQLLNERWATAMHQYNDPSVDLSERPIMYYGGSVWGKLPHQILASANNTLPPKITPADYRAEVRRGLLTPRTSSSSN
ncbi:hypothetical protein N665_0444s0023 [Sinapis alba]|nr:hypothetical protein N665_0444s0023 [Sinapis alba]